MNDESAKELVDRLLAAGMSEAEIAKSLTGDGVPITQPTVNRIKNGASTSFEIGKALVRLAHSRCKPGKRGNVALSV